jgi:DNA polymerase I
MNYKYIDLETDLSHKITWCIAEALDDDPPLLIHGADNILAAMANTYTQEMDNYVTPVAHNAIGFERHRFIEQGYNMQWDDTLVMSRLWNPSLEGGHSLSAWGKRLGHPKGEFDIERFDEGYCDEMGEYCKQDVVVLRHLHETLKGLLKQDGFSARSVGLEHLTAAVTDDMCRRGFPFNTEDGEKIAVHHMHRMSAITRELQERWPPIVNERYSEKTGKRLKDEVIEFNVGSRQQIATRLELEGVKFTEFTPTGRPKIDENTLSDLDHPAAHLISEYLSLMKMSGMVDSWLKNVDEDGRIRGYVNPCGTVTGRMTHSNPNLGQIPIRGGKMYRELFTASEGKVIVGADASGLELRMLAHYMQDDEYTHHLLEGDIHAYNQAQAGLETRDQAKTFIYAFLYGAGNAKIGSIVGGNAKDGAALKAKFLDGIPKLRDLQAKVGRIAASGSLPGLDGRRVRVRHAHAALNTLLQSAGAIVMKQAMIKLPFIRDFELLMHVHDEFQGETEPGKEEDVGNRLVNTIVQAGKDFELRCPLDGEWKSGLTWADTH